MKYSIPKILILLTPCAILQALAMDIFVSGLPEMKLSLDVSEHQIQYILTSFMMATGLCQLFIGVLADRFGRRYVMISALILFALTSLFCAQSTNIFSLTLNRFAQGIAAAACLVVTFAIVRDLFDSKEASRVYSYLSCSTGLAPLIAPLLGTWLMSLNNSWQITFYFLFALSLIVLLTSFKYLPETRNPNTKIQNLNELVYHQKQIIKDNVFWIYSLTGMTALSGLFLFFSIGSILLIDVLHITPYQFSFLFGVNAIIFFTGNYLSGHLAKKISSHKICQLGNISTLIGSALMLLLPILFGLSTFNIVASNLVITFGGGIMIGPAAAGALKPFKLTAGVAAGLFGSIQYGGAAIIGFISTRVMISNSTSIAMPMLVLAIINLLLITNKSLKVKLGQAAAESS